LGGWLRKRSQKENVMLRVYEVIVVMLRLLRGVIERIEKRDPDLGRQLRRAASSVALNTAEGSDSMGRNRLARYHTALGSMRETVACLDVAVAWGYVDGLDPELVALMNRVTGTLVRLVHG
jgi:four helix bundle protein